MKNILKVVLLMMTMYFGAFVLFGSGLLTLSHGSLKNMEVIFGPSIIILPLLYVYRKKIKAILTTKINGENSLSPKISSSNLNRGGFLIALAGLSSIILSIMATQAKTINDMGFVRDLAFVPSVLLALGGFLIAFSEQKK